MATLIHQQHSHAEWCNNRNIGFVKLISRVPTTEVISSRPIFRLRSIHFKVSRKSGVDLRSLKSS